jgi:hypothetical protein
MGVAGIWEKPQAQQLNQQVDARLLKEIIDKVLQHLNV